MDCDVGRILDTACDHEHSLMMVDEWVPDKKKRLVQRLEAEMKLDISTVSSICSKHFQEFDIDYEWYQKTITGCCDPYSIHPVRCISHCTTVTESFFTEIGKYHPYVIEGRRLCYACRDMLTQLHFNDNPPDDHPGYPSNNHPETDNTTDNRFKVPTSYDYEAINRLYKDCLSIHSCTIQPYLKQFQAECVHKVLLGRDVLCVLPTNYGKTLAMIVPTFIRAKINKETNFCIIVSPLKTLMNELSIKLGTWNLPNYILTKSNLSSGEAKEFFEGCASGLPVYIIGSPETFCLPDCPKLLCNLNITNIVIDEVQTTVEWGSEFRESFSFLYDLRQYIDCPLALFTATFTEKMIPVAIKNTGLMKDNMELITCSPDRPEIFLMLMKKGSAEENLKFLVDEYIKHKSKMTRTIVFVNSIQKVHDLNLLFRSMLPNKGRVYKDGALFDYTSEHFSSSTEPKARERILKDFSDPNGCIRVLFSTISYGLGIDNKTIKRVVVYDNDLNATSVWQKVGRACRDGTKGRAIFFSRGIGEKTIFARGMCLRSCILTDFIGYVSVPEVEACNCQQQICSCKLCMCCSICQLKCPCSGCTDDICYDQDDDIVMTDDEDNEMMME